MIKLTVNLPVILLLLNFGFFLAKRLELVKRALLAHMGLAQRQQDGHYSEY